MDTGLPHSSFSQKGMLVWFYVSNILAGGKEFALFQHQFWQSLTTPKTPTKFTSIIVLWCNEIINIQILLLLVTINRNGAICTYIQLCFSVCVPTQTIRLSQKTS